MLFRLSIVFAQQPGATVLVPLSKVVGVGNAIPFELNVVVKETEAHKYVVDIKNAYKKWMVGKLNLNPTQQLYLKNKELFVKRDSIYHFDQSTLCDQLTNQTIHVFIAVSKRNEKVVIIDANDNGSFGDDKVHIVNFLQKPVKQLHTIIPVKKCAANNYVSFDLPIRINLDYVDGSEKAIDKDLQVYIAPDLYYAGDANLGNTRFGVVMPVQNFDLSYDSLRAGLVINDKSGAQINGYTVRSGRSFSVQQHHFKFLKYDPLRTQVVLQYLYKDSTGTQIGDFVKDSMFVSIDRKPVDFTRSPYTILFFSGSWCEPCKQILPLLQQMYRSYGTNIQVVNVNYERTAQALHQYVADYHIQWPVVLDLKNDQSTSTLRGLFNIDGYPTVLIVDSDRKIINRQSSVVPCKQALAALTRQITRSSKVK